ncbi:MAG TPA: UDP-N-acetylmuramoyl-L-alanyl-D-glutamate--2,6-diaminopimelate ligase [Bdellovibrionales bacterium]|nr:UDP-N-acetylmuramoyl-L-alanyl-D-glutamate--2,6-diaminopimelate ligase [Bdellovibrionales bacterium]
MNLTDLLSEQVTAITSNSKAVQPGSVFVAIPGVNREGTEFIGEAIARGAKFIVSEAAIPGVEMVLVENARLALASLAARFYDRPSHSMIVVGVTGTSGKTTTTYVMESILKAAGHKTGVIGTVSFRYGDTVLPSTHTTPDSVELQRLLAEMKNAGCTEVVMEVSSHSLCQHRIADTAFDAVAFTNLSPEHQDFHENMEHYFLSKAMLFNDAVDFSAGQGKRPACAVNIDDPYGKRLVNELTQRQADRHGKFRILPFSVQDPESRFTSDLTGIRGDIAGVPVKSRLIGLFNASNIATAVTLAQGLGISTEAIQKGVRDLTLVPGRLQRIENPDNLQKRIHVFVDYAHKPDALEKVLQTLRQTIQETNPARQLITVFGCGGDRDRKKRPLMGRIAMEISDQVWITSDNPRTEDPDQIIQEVASGAHGIKDGGALHIEADRRKAITKALKAARAEDVVVIAGKGHEDYQIIADPQSPGGTRKIHLDDCEIATEVLKILPFS